MYFHNAKYFYCLKTIKKTKILMKQPNTLIQKLTLPVEEYFFPYEKYICSTKNKKNFLHAKYLSPQKVFFLRPKVWGYKRGSVVILLRKP